MLDALIADRHLIQRWIMKKILIATAMAVLAVAALDGGVARADESGFYHEYPQAQRRMAQREEQNYVSNGSFDWRRRHPGVPVPWYAYSQSGNCFVWTPNAYHYACDPNSRY